MTKIVISKNRSGFRLNREMTEEYLKRVGRECHWARCAGTNAVRDKIYVPFDWSIDDPRESIAFTSTRYDRESLFWEWDLDRDDPVLVSVVEDYYEKLERERPVVEGIITDSDVLNSMRRDIQDLRVVEIPDDVEWEIGEYDYGCLECVVEKHRVWY